MEEVPRRCCEKQGGAECHSCGKRLCGHHKCKCHICGGTICRDCAHPTLDDRYLRCKYLHVDAKVREPSTVNEGKNSTENAT